MAAHDAFESHLPHQAFDRATDKGKRELLGVMVTRSAAGGYLVTSGVFTDEARRFAEASNIVLIDGEKLAYLLSETG